ncbi:hypothetical protein ACFFUB_03440, partial [Algimonas porphyrae]|uniref:hypothetical protein n=1 Tax=Algimonas porphyrae TaxID=1128113 RepID=UPI0035EDB55C
WLWRWRLLPPKTGFHRSTVLIIRSLLSFNGVSGLAERGGKPTSQPNRDLRLKGRLASYPPSA